MTLCRPISLRRSEWIREASAGHTHLALVGVGQCEARQAGPIADSLRRDLDLGQRSFHLGDEHQGAPWPPRPLPPFEDELRIELEQSDFRPLAITFDHARAVSKLPLHHRDPFDRMLIAQARCEDLTLLTADRAIAAYDVRTIDASR